MEIYLSVFIILRCRVVLTRYKMHNKKKIIEATQQINTDN